MLLKTKLGNRTLYRSKPLLLTAKQGYIRPAEGKEWFATTTSVWRVDELIRRRVRDWKRMMGEDGHTGTRAESFRKDHESVYTATHSVFPAPLVEWILLRYAPAGCRVIDAFSGGPPRPVVAAFMGYQYVGFEIRQEQIDENVKLLKELGLTGAEFIRGDGTLLEADDLGQFDAALTCPPYYNIEKYSDLIEDLSNSGSYEAFRTGIQACAEAHWRVMKPNTFTCFVVGNFRDKSGELVDFRAHAVEDFRAAGFKFWQEIILSKNFGSAAKRSTNAWRGQKLVPIHEFLLVFKKKA